jgi:SAM-dependent methyltransferase
MATNEALKEEYEGGSRPVFGAAEASVLGHDGKSPSPRVNLKAVVTPQTWHYGLVARWWAEFNEGGPEVAYFRRYVERGQPALDVACGTGRLLIPYLQAGLDVDGCDVSADMIALCREKAEGAGLSPTLFVQPMHELEPPRSYRTIFVCGGFGLGSNRERDAQALSRFYENLESGGTLVLDNENPYSSNDTWRYWLKAERDELPRQWAPLDAAERRRGSDGAEYALQAKVIDLDPLEQRITYGMRAAMWRDGELAHEEEHTLHITLYFKNELFLLLERAGFTDIVVHGDYREEAPTRDSDFIVFVAKKR